VTREASVSAMSEQTGAVEAVEQVPDLDEDVVQGGSTVIARSRTGWRMYQPVMMILMTPDGGYAQVATW
jgi:hypothetical protein